LLLLFTLDCTLFPALIIGTRTHCNVRGVPAKARIIGHRAYCYTGFYSARMNPGQIRTKGFF